MTATADPAGPAPGRHQLVGLALGPATALVMLLAEPPDGLEAAAWATAATGCWMALWWATEAVPVAVTALLPLVLFPVLGVASISAAAAPFANPLIYLFLGGFLIALAMQRWNLHRRIALNIVARAGSRPAALVAGVMAATALLSMWISNTATAMMMMPIAASLAVIAAPDTDGAADAGSSPFGVALMLGTAYAASIGGLATLVGSPPNALLAAFMNQTYGVRIGFAEWMVVGLPVTVVMLPLAWLMLVRKVAGPPAQPTGLSGAREGAASIAEALRAMGPIATGEKRVAAVFALVAVLWLTRPLIGSWLGADALSDPGIAIFGAVLLFVVPADWKSRVFLLDWDWARRAPWDILILFGGGLSLAQAVDRTGLAQWIGGGLSVLTDWPAIALVAAVAGLIIFLTELTSNTATTAAFLPVVGAVAVTAGIAPLNLALPAALAASCAFMLPVATPPNAIVFGSGHVTIGQMMRAGLLLNLAGLAVVTAATYLLAGLVFS